LHGVSLLEHLQQFGISLAILQNLAKQAKINLQQFAKVTCQNSQVAIPRCRARIFAHANPTAYPSSRACDSSSRAVEEFSSPSRVTEARLLLYFFPPPSSRYLRQHRPPSSRVLSTTRRSRGLVPWSFSRTGSSPAGLTLPDLIPASTSTDLVLAIDVHRWWFV